MLMFIRVGVVREILPRLLIYLLGMVVFTLASTSFDSLLAIIELVPFLYYPFYIDGIVIYLHTRRSALLTSAT